MTPRRALLIVILTSAVARLAWAASLGPGNDESYFLLYTRHLDWSYFDHPPMVAWVAWLGLRLAPVLPAMLAMRLGFIALFAGSTWLLFRLTSRFFGLWAGVLAAMVLNVAGYFPLAAGSFALPDGPLVFFWLATLERVAAALSAPIARRHRLWPWVSVGLAWGGALLSKYHAVLLPLGVALFLVLEPRGRAWLKRPGPYLALAVGLCLFAPVLGWNAAHGWASFTFQGGRALGSAAGWPRFDRLALAALGQVLYVFPWIWLPLLGTFLAVMRSWTAGQGGQSERFFACQAFVPLAAFLCVGCWQALLPHWSLIGLLPLMPLAGRALERWPRARAGRLKRKIAIWAVAPCTVAGAVLLHTNLGVLQRDGVAVLPLIGPARDPSLDLYGWRQVAQAITERGLVHESDAFVITSKWFHSSQLGFAMPNGPPVLCYSQRAALGYAQWSRPEQWVGRSGILAVVNHSSTEPAAFERWFERIEPIGTVTVDRAGAPVKVVQLYRCVRQTTPFPYAGLHPPDVAASPVRQASSEPAARR